MSISEDKINKSNAEWKKELPPDVYRVTREKGTEAPFTGQYWNTYDSGRYFCSNCGVELFASENKYDAACGWPSFDAPSGRAKISETPDTSHGLVRTEVACARCGAHLGHVFADGPKETGGRRYCINSAALKFRRANQGGATPGSASDNGKRNT